MNLNDRLTLQAIKKLIDQSGLYRKTKEKMNDYFISVFQQNQEIPVVELLDKIYEDKKNYGQFLFSKLNLSGVCKQFENGNLTEEISFESGKFHGSTKYYNTHGDIIKEEKWENDKFIEEIKS